MSKEAAELALNEAWRQVSLRRTGIATGPGAREAALAATKVEEAQMWMERAEQAYERALEKERTGSSSAE